jgi:acetoin utilization deacetylase AcuC-like enzyme
MGVTRLKLYFCDHHELPLPAGHKFPIGKYRLLREILAQDPRIQLEPSSFAPLAFIEQVHDTAYVKAFLSGMLDKAAIRRIGFPWSEGLVWRTLGSVGGTLAATREALDYGIGCNLAGGTHHAFRSAGAGFCVFNDLAIGTEWARQQCGLRRIAIVDLDVHQGDGTAAIFENDPDVYTLSLHGARNFPFRKQRSRCDIEFADGTADCEYLAVLERSLTGVWEFDPELIFFQSGVDALADDRLGRLSLSAAAIAMRDRLVLEEAIARKIPVVITLGGGYSDPIDHTVSAHAKTFQTAADIYVMA